MNHSYLPKQKWKFVGHIKSLSLTVGSTLLNFKIKSNGCAGLMNFVVLIA